MILCSEASGPLKVLPTPISIPCWRLSVPLPILSIYMTTTNSWLGRMGNSFNQAITLLSLMVGFFIATIFGLYSVRIGSVSVTDEVPLIWAVSLPSGTRVESFRDAVFQRDKRCIITGNQAMYADVGKWLGFEATHIFPLAFERQWNDCNLSRLITAPPANESHGSINSVQNGIMLTSTMHQFFASYDVSINPDVCRARYSRLRG